MNAVEQRKEGLHKRRPSPTCAVMYGGGMASINLRIHQTRQEEARRTTWQGETTHQIALRLLQENKGTHILGAKVTQLRSATLNHRMLRLDGKGSGDATSQGTPTCESNPREFHFNQDYSSEVPRRAEKREEFGGVAQLKELGNWDRLHLEALEGDAHLKGRI